jgi:hypothetical protein
VLVGSLIHREGRRRRRLESRLGSLPRRVETGRGRFAADRTSRGAGCSDVVGGGFDGLVRVFRGSLASGRASAGTSEAPTGPADPVLLAHVRRRRDLRPDSRIRARRGTASSTSAPTTASCMPTRSAAPAAAGPARRSGRPPPAATSTPRPRSPTAWSTSAPAMASCMPTRSAATAAAGPAPRSGRPPPAEPSTPRPRSPTASSTSAPTTASCMPYAVGCASGGGTCTPLWTATTGATSTPRPRSPTASSTSAPPTASCMPTRSAAQRRRVLHPALDRHHRQLHLGSSPAVANGVVYVGSGDGKLYAYAVGCASGGGTCTPLWTATTGSYIDLLARGRQRRRLRRLRGTASCMPTRSAAPAAAGPARRSGRPPPAATSTPRPRWPTASSTSGRGTASCMPT